MGGDGGCGEMGGWLAMRWAVGGVGGERAVTASVGKAWWRPGGSVGGERAVEPWRLAARWGTGGRAAGGAVGNGLDD